MRSELLKRLGDAALWPYRRDVGAQRECPVSDCRCLLDLVRVEVSVGKPRQVRRLVPVCASS
jgi:hypothetical protein